MFDVTHTVLLLVLAVSGGIHVAVLGIAIHHLREAQRLTRAVGALVIQEEEKTRRLFTR
jgi:hypothetical protein